MSCTTHTITIASPSTRAKELALSARKLLEDLKDIEVGMIASNDWRQQCPRRAPSHTPSLPQQQSLPCRTPTNSSRHQSLFLCQPFVNDSTLTSPNGNPNRKPVSGAFVAFCDHLLYSNHAWKQERQIRALRASIRATEKAKCSNAFKSFCDRLLLSNRVWQLERQIQELVTEGEKNKRARVAAVTRAAQQMAVDVRKEAMIEEFVVELMQELQENKKAVHGMKEKHEGEIREVHGDWLKEYRRLAQENEKLRLERGARLVEQEISNEVEQSLSDAVERSHQRIKELECGDGDSTLIGDALDHGSVLFSGSSSSVDDTEMDDLEVNEGMSTMSSATYVSLGEMSNWSAKCADSLRDQRCATAKTNRTLAEKKRLLRRQSVPLHELDTAPYAGFSFNPLFFGNPETLVVSPSRPENVDTPVKVTLKLGSSSSLSTRSRKNSVARLVGPTGTRGPWRL